MFRGFLLGMALRGFEGMKPRFVRASGNKVWLFNRVKEPYHKLYDDGEGFVVCLCSIYIFSNIL